MNNAYQVAPQAGICYFADARWYGWHKDVDAFKQFAGQKCTIDGTECEHDSSLFIMRQGEPTGLSRDPARLATGGNGGYQAINLAALSGARRIVLLGFDMRYIGGKQNWHKGHPVKSPERWVNRWLPNFRGLAKELAKDKVDVVNATPESALDAFRKAPIAELLPDAEQKQERA